MDLAVLFVVALVGGFYLAWGCTDQIGLITGDGPNYLMMAKSYAHAGSGRVAAEVAASSRFPPLYPLLLARVGGADSLPVAHIVTVLCFVLALLAHFAWQRLGGLPHDVCLVLMLAAAAVPDIWLSALMIQSEYLYLFLSLLAVALLTAYRTDHRDGFLHGAAFAIVLAILTRTIGIVLLVPLLVAVLKASWRQRVIVAAVVVLPLGLWYGLHRARGGGYFVVLGDYLHNGSARQAVDFLGQQFAALRAGFVKAMLLQPQSLHWLADAFATIGIASATWRAIRGEPDGLYVCAYFAVLAMWPYPGDAHRLIWPVLPLLIVQPVLVARTIGTLRRTPATATRVAAAAYAGVVLAMALPSITYAWQRSRDAAAADIAGAAADPVWYWPDRAEAGRFTSAEYGLVRALERVRASVPETDCVISIRPDWINFYADRRSELPLPEAAPDAAFFAALRETGCRYIFMTTFLDRAYGKPLYPIERLAGHLAIVDRSEASTPDSPRASAQFVLAHYNP